MVLGIYSIASETLLCHFMHTVRNRVYIFTRGVVYKGVEAHNWVYDVVLGGKIMEGVPFGLSKV